MPRNTKGSARKRSTQGRGRNARRRYAQRTRVSEDRSQAQIQAMLKKFGAQSFALGWDQDSAGVRFRYGQYVIKLEAPLPARDQFAETPTGRGRPKADVERRWKEARRQVWRALRLIIQAKLAAIDGHIASFEDEFIGYAELGNGQTVAEWAKDRIPEIGRGSASELPALADDSQP